MSAFIVLDTRGKFYILSLSATAAGNRVLTSSGSFSCSVTSFLSQSLLLSEVTTSILSLFGEGSLSTASIAMSGLDFGDASELCLGILVSQREGL